MDVGNATVLVAGLGISGRSSCAALNNRARRVITVDEHKAEADVHSFADIPWASIDMVVTSPVFNPRTPFIIEAQRRSIPVMSEVELAWQLRVNSTGSDAPAPWIGITGTNGKTSTTEMTSAMLTDSGLTAPAVGNIGKAVSHAALDASNQALCVELSSFQLHFTDSLRLACAAITNLADDHLDWHGGFANYAADKAKVYRGVTKTLVYNADDERVTALAMKAQPAAGCKKVGFTLSVPHEGQIGVEDGWIVDASGLASGSAKDSSNRVTLAKVTEFKHMSEPDGTIYPHLVADSLCALALALGFGIRVDDAIKALKHFAPGGHRIQTVATASFADGSIRFVDDSKATNAHAAAASLSSFADHSVVWIAGGLAKGSQFEQLVADERKKIKAAVIIGKEQEPMRKAFAASAPDIATTVIDPADNDTVMQRAVDACGSYARAGDVVLMAPACASMDQFVSYADRGDQFVKQASRWVQDHAQND
ncbi:UDP-N-acetylmuramoyl-L-alanine--D-glutamate ligase [Bifidobacterium aquikefiricola]|uniref:UDP-N-acetylmuramoylalanine--D-glutamate ligase n=1 Tax=Bifidobacterium aquikefiricola TaxID=3059038 RepID=A0AB39U8I2_9BIFI